MSESSMDANTPEVNRKQESFKSSESSLGSLLDEYNDDDLEKTNATLGNYNQFHANKSLSPPCSSRHPHCGDCAVFRPPVLHHLHPGHQPPLGSPGPPDHTRPLPPDSRLGLHR